MNSPIHSFSARGLILLGLAAMGCALLGNCSLISTAASVGLIKLQFGCLPEGTRIDTPEGPRPVEELAAGDIVTGYDGSPVVVRQVHQYQENPDAKRHLAVHFTNGAQVRLSPRHRIDGIPAGDLRPGDAVAGHVVSRLHLVDGVSRSYDLLTDDDGYRIGGIPVNSMIAEMAGQAARKVAGPLPVPRSHP